MPDRTYPAFDRFGPFMVHECLGAGGMATVHRASIDIGLGATREVALKRLLPQYEDDLVFVRDFVREAKLGAQLDHPNIVKTLELGRVGSTYFITTELVRGTSLCTLMAEARETSTRVPMRVVLALLIELCDALEYVSCAIDHTGQPLRVVHRDVSPSNLLVTDTGHLMMIDFGVATAEAGPFATNTGLVKGKLGYMAPEGTRDPGRIDVRADIYSAGVVAWELLCGRRLCSDATWDLPLTTIQPPSEIVPSCPRAVDRIILKALAHERTRRWQSAGAMRDALAAIAARRPSTPDDVAHWAREVTRAAANPAMPRSRSSAVTRREIPYRRLDSDVA